ncbi:hypothetical protein OOT55_14045 [Marinimicrobium sp. C6131]|uniref:hypothetical protein n=1 Tax=Marinimicrobium sp. C6131 TaxID=3022676 RepID=UPI00223D04A1|nr:hypothetical protein [Marinimicrobium sp. C6131]UZJ43768.1 hypothetical protein OOT55_14045 [Marinimicrobium sp. C6131]
MNTNLKLLAALIMGGALAACGGSSSDDGPNNSSSSASSTSSSSSSSDGVDCEANPFDPACIEEDPVTEIDITNEDIPLHETFAVTGEGNQVAQFYSTDYKELNTAGANEDYVDDHPSFYYPTCCFWETDEETGEPTGNLVPDIDVRQYVGIDADGNGYFAFSNARWSIGQLQPDIVSDEESEDNDAKSKTTNAPVGSSWGELDLSVPYRISFCLKDSGLAGAGTGGNLEVYVDNNSGGNQGHSIHGNQSLLMRTEAAALSAGNRVVIDVPGDVRLQDNNGDQVDLISTTAEVYGTENSFLQMRVSSGGYVVISDLMIEHQDNLVGDYTPCEADESLFTPPLPEGYAFPGLPLNEDFDDITKEQLIGDGEDIAGEFMAISSDLTIPFYKFNSTGRLAITETGELHISNNRFTMGFAGVENTAEGDTEVAGDIDLSEPYTLTLEIAERPASDEGRLQVLVDNSTTGSANSIHGENSVLLGTTWGLLGTGTLEINVPGDVLLNNEPVLDENGDPVTIDTHVGTATSFLQIWCPSDCGADIESEGFGVKFDSIMLDNQDDGGDPNAIWTADAYVLAGGTTDAEGTVDAETENSVTITATGGKSDSSSDLNMFFAGQQIEMSDFAYTARIASVSGADVGVGNSYRFGIMAIADLTAAGSLANVAPWAAAGFYANSDPVELIGTRSNMKENGERTRSNIPELEVGHYVRIEIFDDAEGKRVRRCVSPDGVTWTAVNSTNDFSATAETDSWYYGVWAAPGENNVTMEVDNISVEAYETDCESLNPA